MKAASYLTGLLIAATAIAMPPLEQSHTLDPLKGEWLYVRASEASTLFLSEHSRGQETTCAIVEKDGELYFTETAPSGTRSFAIERIEQQDRSYTLRYKGHSFAEKTIIYPFRDVDETWVLIHFVAASENPVHFITLASNRANIPYLNE